MLQMMQWATETLQAASMGPAAVPLALLLGLVSAVASACCTLPAMGMLVAYSGTREAVSYTHLDVYKRQHWWICGRSAGSIWVSSSKNRT